MVITKLHCLAAHKWNPDGVQCHFKKGKDAKGVNEIDIGPAETSGICFRNVVEYKEGNSQHSINGATWHGTHKRCYAELEATTLGDSVGWESCIFSGIERWLHVVQYYKYKVKAFASYNILNVDGF